MRFDSPYARTAVWLLIAGCSASTNDVASYAGSADGLLMSALVLDDAFVAYSCGDDGMLDANTAWFAGTVEEGRLVPRTHETATLAADVDEARLVGTLETPSGAHAFELEEVGADGAIFLALEGGCRTALIAFRTSSGMRVQGAHFCADEGPFFQVTPIRPVTGLEDVVDVSFTDDTGLRELPLERVVMP